MDVALPDGTPGVGQSTSLASAYVAGVVVALRSYRPELSVEQTEALLRATARPTRRRTGPRRRRGVPCGGPGRDRRCLSSAAASGRESSRVDASAGRSAAICAKPEAQEHPAPWPPPRDPATPCAARSRVIVRTRRSAGRADQVEDHSGHGCDDGRPSRFSSGRRVADPRRCSGSGARRSDETRAHLRGCARVVACAGRAGRADAGTYEVLSCGAAGGVNHAWQSLQPGHRQPSSNGDSCASLAGGPTDGLFAVDRIPGPPNSPKGRAAGWRLTAPAGTRITRLTAQFYLGQNSDGEWFPYIRTSSGQVLETCQPPGGDPECERGAGDYHPFGPVWTYDAQHRRSGGRCQLRGVDRRMRQRRDIASRVAGAVLHPRTDQRLRPAFADLAGP